MPTMFILPWRWTAEPRSEHTLVFASRFDGTGPRRGWRLFLGGIRLRRAALRSPGALGVGLRAHPLKGRYYTLSMWKDEESLKAFARGDDHRAAVRHVNELGPVSGVLLAKEADALRPRWADTLRWVDGAEPAPYRLDTSPVAAK
jgi:hypothetical protein